jgi:HTH-type transcriptional regulator/antitoxin HigA
MTAITEKKLSSAWKQVGPMLTIDSPASYRHACRLLDDLTDEIGGNESHPLASLMDTLGTLIHAWEAEHEPTPKATPRQVLALLMKEHGLKQADLGLLGSQGVVSEILAGKRDLNVRQIKALSKRFKVNPSVFL